jgi:hypothetical protein
VILVIKHFHPVLAAYLGLVSSAVFLDISITHHYSHTWTTVSVAFTILSVVQVIHSRRSSTGKTVKAGK